MEKNKKTEISSRNKNKNKNKALQTRVKNKEVAKTKKAKAVASKLDDNLENVSIEDFSNSKVEGTKETVLEEKVSNLKTDDNLSNELLESPLSEGDIQTIIDSSNKIDVNVIREEEEKSDKSVSDKLKQKEDKEDDYLSKDKEELKEVPVHHDVKEINHNNNSLPSDMLHNDVSKEKTPVSINAKKHVSFESRVSLLLLFIVISLFIGGCFILRAVTPVNERHYYDDKSTSDYLICAKGQMFDDHYTNSCFKDNGKFSSSYIDLVAADFMYNRKYYADFSKNLKYYVIANVTVYSDFSQQNPISSFEDILIDKTNFDSKKGKMKVSVDIPYSKYFDYVKGCVSLGRSAYVTVGLFIDDGVSLEEVSSIKMPLFGDNIKIEKNNYDRKMQEMVIDYDNSKFKLKDVSPSFMAVGIVFLIIGFTLLIKLILLICKVFGKSNLYQVKLNKILKDYDHIIVNARGNYNVNLAKNIVKVSSFEELLDARSTLSKPIVYVKVNNVKSDFYVEDYDTIFVFTLKEADVTNEKK